VIARPAGQHSGERGSADRRALWRKGQPLANTTVVITDDSGKQIGKEKTDENGVLVYDFPGRGKTYQLKWKGGLKDVTIPRFSTTQKIGAGAGAVGIVTLGAVLMGGGDEELDEERRRSDADAEPTPHHCQHTRELLPDGHSRQ